MPEKKIKKSTKVARGWQPKNKGNDKEPIPPNFSAEDKPKDQEVDK